MKNIIYFFIVFILLSCNQSPKQFSYIDLSASTPLDSAEVIYTFDDKYPISIRLTDSLMFVILVKSDTCLTVINTNTKEVIASLGPVGNGPDDLVSPSFILSTDNPNVLIEDVNLQRIIKINTDIDSLKLQDYTQYPESLFGSSELNLSENFIVGRKVNPKEKKMFFVYNRNKGTTAEADYFPELNAPLSDYNYTYAPVLALNEKQNRVIAGMYFFDLFHVYDLEGSRIKTFCFSENCVPSINAEAKMLDLREGYAGIIRAYSTTKYCYLLRVEYKPEYPDGKQKIIQIDWNGKFINSYDFTDDISGQFYVDEHSNKIYLIRNHMNSEGEDLFDIVSYPTN